MSLREALDVTDVMHFHEERKMRYEGVDGWVERESRKQAPRRRRCLGCVFHGEGARNRGAWTSLMPPTGLKWNEVGDTAYHGLVERE